MDYRKRQHRRRQYNEPGHAHELTFCCYNRFKFLQAERTCQWLADELNEARVKHEFHLWAYVSMPDHVSLSCESRMRIEQKHWSHAQNRGIAWPQPLLAALSQSWPGSAPATSSQPTL